MPRSPSHPSTRGNKMADPRRHGGESKSPARCESPRLQDLPSVAFLLLRLLWTQRGRAPRAARDTPHRPSALLLATERAQHYLFRTLFHPYVCMRDAGLMAEAPLPGAGRGSASLECQRERIHHGTRGAAGPHGERHGRQVFRGASLTLHHGLPRPVTAYRLHHEVTTPTSTTSYISSSINTGVHARGARCTLLSIGGNALCMSAYSSLPAFSVLLFLLSLFCFSAISFRTPPPSSPPT